MTNQTAPQSLLTWLDRAISEREDAARQAAPGPWATDMDNDQVVAVDSVTVADVFSLSGGQLRSTALHIAANDPASVLRRCATDRKLLKSLKALIEGDYIDDGEPVLAEHVLGILAEGYGWTEGER